MVAFCYANVRDNRLLKMVYARVTARTASGLRDWYGTPDLVAQEPGLDGLVTGICQSKEANKIVEIQLGSVARSNLKWLASTVNNLLKSN
jgi:hypothetical protein